MSDTIKKCQYALDPNDPYCKNCNGITMMVDGKEYSCTECAGYVASADNEGVTVEEETIVQDEPVSEEAEKVEDTSETSQDAHTDDKESDSTISTQEDVESNPDTSKSNPDVNVIATESETEEITLPDGVTVKSLRYMSGATIIKTEPNGKESYYKFSAEEEWEVSEEVGSDADKIQDVRDKLWAKLNIEVDSQVEELFK